MSIKEKLTKIAEDMPKVYDAGIAEGRNAEREAFWDGLQGYGAREGYGQAFEYWSGTEEINPKYTIRTNSLYRMFFNCHSLKRLTSDIVPIGETFTGAYGAFNKCYLLEAIDFDICLRTETGDANLLNSTFYDCRALKTIKKLGLDGFSYVFSSTFAYCGSLENLTIEGVIASNGFNVQWSTKLSKASIISIVNALSTTTSGLTVTLSKTAVNNAFATDEWNTLIATRSNWTIALA